MSVFKKDVISALENPRSKYFSIINDTLALATIVSILAIVMETVPALFKYETAFVTIEWVTVILFTIEYLLRLWVTTPKREYVLSFFGIIDLLAVLPTFLGIGNLTFLKSARIVRLIRFLRIVRLSKLSRMSMKNAEETLGIFTFNIALYATTLIAVMLVIGGLLHIFDTVDGRYWSIPNGMFWTFSIFLGGLPAPISPGIAGTIIFIIAKFSGMALFGLLVGVVGKIFNGWILGKR